MALNGDFTMALDTWRQTRSPIACEQFGPFRWMSTKGWTPTNQLVDLDVPQSTLAESMDVLSLIRGQVVS